MKPIEEEMLRRLEDLYREKGRVEFVGGFENLVYRLRDDDGGRIIRLTHERDRTRELLVAELDWIRDLAARGISVAEPLPGRAGDWLESLLASSGETYHKTCFAVAPGERAVESNVAIWNEAFFESWGEVLGRMHVAAESYDVPAGAPRRYGWNDDPLLNFEAFMPDDEPEVIEACHAIVGELSRLPATKESFGIIHGDLHQGNFFVDDGRITVFDFDDSLYHWFVFDIATVLYAVCWWTVEGDRERQNAFAERFGKALLRGYRRHRDMPSEWLERIPLFLSLRDALIYAVLHKRLDMAQIPERLRLALDERRSRLLGGGNPIAIDFARL